MSNVSKQGQSAYPINQSPEEMRRLTIQVEVLHSSMQARQGLQS